MSEIREYSGSIQSSDVVIVVGKYLNYALVLDESTVTGTVDVLLRAPGATEYTAPSDNTLTLGSNAGLCSGSNRMAFDAVKLSPDSLSGAVTYHLSVW